MLQTNVYVPSRGESVLKQEKHNTQNESQSCGKPIKTLTEKMTKAYK